MHFFLNLFEGLSLLNNKTDVSKLSTCLDTSVVENLELIIN